MDAHHVIIHDTRKVFKRGKSGTFHNLQFTIVKREKKKSKGVDLSWGDAPGGLDWGQCQQVIF